jgi:putative tryptophan/tyrosine transport system substrate-binding protein
LIAALGSAATWPLAARAQQAPMPVIGLLSGRALKQSEVTAFRKGLAEAGYVEGRNVAIEYRSADNQYDRLPALAAELVRREVPVIAAPDTTSGALAAKAATKSIPIVFGTGADPVQAGLVASLNRPGGNVTGVTRLCTALGPKRLELLRELAPAAAVIGMLVNPANPSAKTQIREGQEATTRMCSTRCSARPFRERFRRGLHDLSYTADWCAPRRE